MTDYASKLQRLLRLARLEAKGRMRAAPALDATRARRLAQRALAALPRRTAPPSHSAGWQPAVSPTDSRRTPKSWLDAFERLCWWGAGATVALCLVLGVLHRPPPEPDAFAPLLEWPASSGESLF
jgi:hypothetical protein